VKKWGEALRGVDNLVGRAIATDAMAKELGIAVPQLGNRSGGTGMTGEGTGESNGRGVIACMHDAIEALSTEKEHLQQYAP
jgi:hypothetical protein